MLSTSFYGPAHQALIDARMVSNQTAIEWAMEGARRHEEEQVAKKRNRDDLVECEYCQQLNDINESLDCEMCGGRLKKPKTVFDASKVEPYIPNAVSSDTYVYAATTTAAHVVMDSSAGML